MRILRCLAPLFAFICISCDSPTDLEKTNLQGSWQGTGEIVESSYTSKGKNYKCNQIDYRIESNGAELNIDARRFLCVGMKKNFSAVKFRTQGNKLYLGSEEVGSFYKDGFTVAYPTSNKPNSQDGGYIDFTRSSENIIIVERHVFGRQQIDTYTVIDLKSDEDSI